MGAVAHDAQRVVPAVDQAPRVAMRALEHEVADVLRVPLVDVVTPQLAGAGVVKHRSALAQA